MTLLILFVIMTVYKDFKQNAREKFVLPKEKLVKKIPGASPGITSASFEIVLIP